jgi:hypothetical protein
MEKQDITAANLGAAFVWTLKDWLTIPEWNDMARLNKTASPGVCHSHDFCDANMAMIEAYADLLGVPADDVDLSEPIRYLFNDAWSWAVPALVIPCES